MPRRLALALLLATLVSPEARAAELYLKNGDKLTGVLLRREAGLVHLRHLLLGELIIPEAQLTRLVEDTPTQASATTLAPKPPVSQEADRKTPAAASGQKAASAPPAKAVASQDDDDEPVYSTWLKGWKRVMADAKGALELGYQDQSGRKKTSNFSLRANAEYTNLPNNYRFDWRYYYGQYNDTVQTDKKDWTFRWRRDLSKRFFTQTITSYASDRIKSIDMNLEQSVGAGYAALNTNRQKFNLGASVVGQHRVILKQDTGIIALGEFFEDYTRKLSSRFSIRQESLIQYSPISRSSYTVSNGQLVHSTSEESNYKYRFNAALQGKVNERISLNLRFEYEFDNNVADASLKADRRISTTLGYTF